MYGLSNKMTFGVDPILQYYEFNLSSDDSNASFSSQISSKNWPIFRIGGKRSLKNIEGVKILEVEIPFTWYLFQSTDIISITDTETATTTNMSIGTGNFSGNEIATLLTTNYPVTVTYNPNTLKFRIELTNQHTFTVTTASEKLAFLLGLKAGVVYSSIPGTPPNDYLIFPFVAQLTGPNFLYVCSDTLGNLTDMYLPKTTSGGNSGAEMAKIQINVGPGNVIFWRDPDPTKYFDIENTNNLPEIDFYLKTNIPGLDTVLDLNGASFSLKLGIIENDMTQSINYTGLSKNDRVVKRIRAL